MKALVIGYGSIGARHARLLGELGCRTAVLSARSVEFPNVFADLERALTAMQPDYVVIANATDRHHETLATLAELGFDGTVVVEKPLFDRVLPVPANRFKAAFVAYNLRFHPVIRKLKTLLETEKVLTVQAHAGQHLSTWRPSADYRSSYSASAARGGGALRDLSHELDYLAWMLGGWTGVAASGGHLSALEIDSDDAFALLLTTPRCRVVSLQLDYLDRPGRRTILVNTERHTIEADLIRGMVTVDAQSESVPAERDTSYRAMHSAILAGQGDTACSLEEAADTLRLIEAAAQASRTLQWVAR